MGEVYAAYDPELDRKIAIKLLRVGAREEGIATEGRIRLLREAQAIAKLSHANVVTVYDVGTFEDDVFIAMQFVDGHTLRYWVHAQPRAWSEVVKMFADAGRGLAAAHDKDLVHRDFKPDNVMVGDGHVRVMDFGLARAALDRDRKSASAQPAPPLAASSARSAGGGGDLDSTRALGAASHAGGRCHRRGEGGAERRAHAGGRGAGNTGVHVAGAVSGRRHRRALGSVQLLRGAVRGALRRASVHRNDADRSHGWRARRHRAPGARGQQGALVGAQDRAARAARRSARSLAVDDRAARRAGEEPPRARLGAGSPRARRRSWPGSGRRPRAGARAIRR